MTVPTQRGNSSEDPTVWSMVLGAVEDVKADVRTGMAALTAKIDGLDAKFLPRVEYEARHSDLRNTVTKLDAKLEAEGKEREKLEEKLSTSRRFAITTSIAGFCAVVGLLALVLSHLH